MAGNAVNWCLSSVLRSRLRSRAAGLLLLYLWLLGVLFELAVPLVQLACRSRALSSQVNS